MLKKFLNPRFFVCFFACIGFGLMLLLLVISPIQAPVVLYKLTLAMLAAVIGLLFDTAVFPYSNPSSYLAKDWRNEPDANKEDDADYPIAREYKKVFAYSFIRRALIISAFILAISLGL